MKPTKLQLKKLIEGPLQNCDLCDARVYDPGSAPCILSAEGYDVTAGERVWRFRTGYYYGLPWNSGAGYQETVNILMCSDCRNQPPMNQDATERFLSEPLWERSDAYDKLKATLKSHSMKQLYTSIVFVNRMKRKLERKRQAREGKA